jgi:hypothetical protein
MEVLLLLPLQLVMVMESCCPLQQAQKEEQQLMDLLAVLWVM